MVCALHPQSLPPPARLVHRTMVRGEPAFLTEVTVCAAHEKAPAVRGRRGEASLSETLRTLHVVAGEGLEPPTHGL